MNHTLATTTIQPQRGWVALNLPELWRYRELFYVFVWRDLKVRYKQTVIGIAWAILQPLLLMLVFTFFFGKLAKIPSNDVPYPLFVFTGLLFWNYFSTAVSGGSNSLIDNENLIKKIYFPRMILTSSLAITPLVDFLLALLVLLGIFVSYHRVPGVAGLALLPLLAIISLLAAAGLGMLLAAINVRYRDIRYALPFFLQTLIFLTPVIYPTNLVPEPYQILIAINPMTGVIDTARASLLGTQPFNIPILVISALSGLILFILGLFYFRRTENTFADIA